MISTACVFSYFVSVPLCLKMFANGHENDLKASLLANMCALVCLLSVWWLFFFAGMLNWKHIAQKKKLKYNIFKMLKNVCIYSFSFLIHVIFEKTKSVCVLIDYFYFCDDRVSSLFAMNFSDWTFFAVRACARFGLTVLYS